MPLPTLRPFSYLVRALLAGAVLFFAASLSAGDRGAVDYVVLALISAAIAYNLIQVGRRFLSDGRGVRDIWHLLRTLGFWVIGLLNTALIRPEDLGSWNKWVGWGFVVIAAIDTAALLHKEWSLIHQTPTAS